MSVFGVWICENWQWIVGPMVAAGVFMLVWGACWRSGDISQAEEDAGICRRS